MEIIRGKIPCAKKVVCYGPEGIGKSTFASRFPEPLFIDTEGSTKEMDVARTPEPSSWTMLLEQVAYVKAHPQICRTLVIDTVDWAEQMCVGHICAKYQKDGLESFGYGSGYIYEREEFGRFLNRLEELVKTGVNIMLTAHAQMRKFEQPDEMGAYDRWELKLGKKTSSQISPLIKEWADMVLFANYKTFSVAVDDKGKKRKAQGGRRVMYTVHHPCWDAKNRYGLPEEMEFDYSGISHIFQAQNCPDGVGATQKIAGQNPVPEAQGTGKDMTGAQMELPIKEPDESAEPSVREPDPVLTTQPQVSIKIPKELRDLMVANDVGEWDIQEVVAAKGYYPSLTPIENYDPGFVKGVLVGAWPKVLAMIEEMKEKMEVPFD